VVFAPGEIISHAQMCLSEGKSLQNGMHLRSSPDHSVLLMSLRQGALYEDRLEDQDRILIYEGHDARRAPDVPDPKSVDQPEYTSRGTATQNRLFREAATAYRTGKSHPEIVRVYEKLRSGVWTFRGTFRLTDSWAEPSGPRNVFRFRLELTEQSETVDDAPLAHLVHSRLIPSHVMRDVYKADRGKCRRCGAVDNLHFDHVLPFSKGGTSLKAENIQLLCAQS
jgi:hypothetical protein